LSSLRASMKVRPSLCVLSLVCVTKSSNWGTRCWVVQRWGGLRIIFYGVTTAQRSSRRGCQHNTQALPPGSTSSCTIAHSPLYVSLLPSLSPITQPKPLPLKPQSRTAARKELLDTHKSPDECERLYEESLWCLYALQDDLLQKGNPFMEEDRETIATCA
jgi:hypothetical protein